MKMEILERILHGLSSIAVFGILWVEIDDVYGISNLRKLSKRKWRKFLKSLSSKKKSPKETRTVYNDNPHWV